MQNFKSLLVWQKSHEFTLNIYELSKDFPNEELYSLTSQIRRSAYSIPCNIAEGCSKTSQTDFKRFLQISLGSANETEYFLLLSKDLQYIPEKIYLELNDKINAIKAMLISLIRRIQTKTIEV